MTRDGSRALVPQDLEPGLVFTGGEAVGLREDAYNDEVLASIVL